MIGPSAPQNAPQNQQQMDPMLSMLSSAVMSAKQACDAAAMALRLYHESRAPNREQDAAPEPPRTFMAKIDRAAAAGSTIPAAVHDTATTQLPPETQP